MDPLRNRVAALKEAIGLISNVEKVAYLEALKRAPHLVETESDPLCFLQRDGYNCWDAAGRIVAYWEARKKLFGDRAFLPLTLVGESALSLETIRFIRSNAILLLPNDSNGRSVVFCHLGNYSTPVVLQSCFYHCFILMRNTQNRSEGFVQLAKQTNHAGDSRRSKIMIELMRSAMPVKMHSVHMLTTSEINPIMLNLWKWYSKNKAYVHTCKTPEECAAALQTSGFKKEQLPTALGGSWEAVQWDGLLNEDEQEKLQGKNSLRAPPAVEKKRANLKSAPTQPTSKKAKLHGTDEFDVLMGTGRKNVGQGNQRFRALIKSLSARYRAAKSRIEKKEIKLEVLNSVKEKGRIMKYDGESETWEEVSSPYALEKIKEAFQNSLARKKGEK